MLIKRFHYLIILFLFSYPLFAQEFDCEVIINDDQLEGSSFDYIMELKPVLENYINEYQWTDIEFQEHERIKCQVQIILNSGTQDYLFSAQGIFSARRPIYNTNTETTSVIFNDGSWQFTYPQGKSLLHDELQFDDLTAMVDYYCYMLLGYDFDSFSDLGGSPYFAKAQMVVNLAQSSSTVGWSRTSNNRRNRFTLIADILNSSYAPLRTAYYTYHRLGLDAFTQDPDKARSKILAALTMLRDLKRNSTSNYLFDLFFDTKSREVSAVFKDAEKNIQQQAYTVLSQTDPSHLSEYQDLQN